MFACVYKYVLFYLQFSVELKCELNVMFFCDDFSLFELTVCCRPMKKTNSYSAYLGAELSLVDLHSELLFYANYYSVLLEICKIVAVEITVSNVNNQHHCCAQFSVFLCQIDFLLIRNTRTLRKMCFD